MYLGKNLIILSLSLKSSCLKRQEILSWLDYKKGLSCHSKIVNGFILFENYTEKKN